ncbi:MAG: twin-arginine translocase TatA/TatE family subunit [Legionellales bacterium]|nr:twin-arginine translocase TatA/TatE family subunit [Legionellales bacterium]|tara:strand:+ start:278 stop:460 length:183 start_codon:yes stop_codon:yes gene_type:complete
MGPSGISLGSLLLILVVAFVLFGGRRLHSLPEDIVRVIQKFRKGLESSAHSSEKEPPKHV